jgi:hypothetical protein
VKAATWTRSNIGREDDVHLAIQLIFLTNENEIFLRCYAYRISIVLNCSASCCAVFIQMNEWMKNWRWPAFQHSFHFISLCQTRTARETLLLTYYFQLLWTCEHMFVYLVHNFSPGERNYVSWWQLTSHWCSIKKRKYTVLSLCFLPTYMAAKLRSSSCVTQAHDAIRDFTGNCSRFAREESFNYWWFSDFFAALIFLPCVRILSLL